MNKEAKPTLIKAAIAIVVAVLMLVILLGWQILANNISSSDKLRVCPESWINNQMPCVGVRCTNGSYYILNGKRHEITDFDQDWISRNCKLTPTTVY